MEPAIISTIISTGVSIVVTTITFIVNNKISKRKAIVDIKPVLFCLSNHDNYDYKNTPDTIMSKNTSIDKNYPIARIPIKNAGKGICRFVKITSETGEFTPRCERLLDAGKITHLTICFTKGDLLTGMCLHTNDINENLYVYELYPPKNDTRESWEMKQVLFKKAKKPKKQKRKK